MEHKKSAQFFTDALIELQREEGQRITVSVFAERLGIAQSTMSQYLNGSRKPSLESAIRLAPILGNGIFEACGYQQPNTLLRIVSRLWDTLTEQQQQEMADQIEAWAEENKVQ